LLLFCTFAARVLPAFCASGASFFYIAIGLLSELRGQSHQPCEFTLVTNGDTSVMKRCVMCIYLRGSNAAKFAANELAELLKAHLNHIDSPAKTSAVLLVGPGPFGDNGEKRGVLILETGDIESANPWVDADPMVKAGRLAYELHPWWTARQGSFR
jgi:uncharacterized protein YciI